MRFPLSLAGLLLPRLLMACLLPAYPTASAAEPELPPLARADLDGDGHEDLVVSHERGYGVYLFVPPERAKPHLGWTAGWTRVMREGKPGDEAALPLLTSPDVTFADGAMQAGGLRMTYEDLLRVPGPKPQSPEDSLRAMRLPAGVTATLVAAEPLVMDPVFIDWDERGRMWVAEMGDYPFAEGESTSDGKVTWRDGVPGEGAGQRLQAGRVRILEDADGDGRYEKSTIFLDGLKHVTGLACWKGGVFVASVPDIFHARDDDGDGRCDVREPWFTGFKAGNPQHLVNGFCWGLDGWLYGANGDSGGDVVCVKTGASIPLRGNDFRFDPRTGEFRLETGTTQCGKWRDDFGNWFGNNNATPGWHYWLPMSHLENGAAAESGKRRQHRHVGLQSAAIPRRGVRRRGRWLPVYLRAGPQRRAAAGARLLRCDDHVAKTSRRRGSRVPRQRRQVVPPGDGPHRS